MPPLDEIVDAKLRGVLAKALAPAPAERYQHGGELAAALGASTAMLVAAEAAASPPFRHLAAFTETDRLYGRDREIATLVENVLFRRAVVYTAPSGTGKTSLLRAGLCPRLAVLGVECVYVACHGREPPDLARAIWPEGETAAAAAAARIETQGKRLVVVVDQVEAALASTGFATALRELENATATHELGVVFSVREDVLASLLAQLEAEHNVLRLGPLSPEGAREAIAGPLIERRVMIEEPLLAALLADLQRAASLLAAEMRWSAQQAVYPPHLQLACSSLFDQLAPGEEVLAPRHYEQLGGLDEIVRDYLDRVLETELPREQVATARRVLLALVDSDRARAVRTDAELAVLAGEDIAPVLEALRLRGVIVPLRARNGEPAWELVHDSLVPRVLAWTDRQDLARQRALEIVRHHLRGSQGQRPSLLTAGELREVKPFAAAIEELDRDWAARGATGWRPLKVVALSRRARRARWIGAAVSLVLGLGVFGLLTVRWFREREERHHQEMLGKADVGTFILELEPYDWDTGARQPIPVVTSSLPVLDWKLYDASIDDDTIPMRIDRVEVDTSDPRTRAWRVDARGGLARLVVDGRGGACAPSVIPLARTPGYASRDQVPPRFVVHVPTCSASSADTIEVVAGPYLSGGHGDPPVPPTPDVHDEDFLPERIINLSTFRIDRTEVTNASFRMFTAPTNATVVAMPAYEIPSGTVPDPGDTGMPVSGISWATAQAFCRFHGKRLPTSREWEKSLRGGLSLNGAANPMPRRTLPWGARTDGMAHIKGDQYPHGALSVDATPGDVSPYGVVDLAGNVQEWTRSRGDSPGMVVIRGCGWGLCTKEVLPAWVVIENVRPLTFISYELGFRCVADPGSRGDD